MILEDSVENFVLQWRPYAAEVEVFATIEGNPLIEVRANDVILQLFERTNPYLSKVGKAQIIIHPVVQRIDLLTEPAKEMRPLGISQIQLKGLVLMRDDPMLIVDAGVPLVVGVPAGIDDHIAEGEWIEIASLAPIHGFVLARRHLNSYSSHGLV